MVFISIKICYTCFGDDMNIKILVGVILIVVISGLFIILKYFGPNNSSKLLELTYKKSAGIPYNWKYEIEDENIVKYVKNYVIKNENTGGKVGAPIYTNYVFEGLREGVTTITFKLVHINENDIFKEEKTIVKVDKDLNISIVNEEEGN